MEKLLIRCSDVATSFPCIQITTSMVSVLLVAWQGPVGPLGRVQTHIGVLVGHATISGPSVPPGDSIWLLLFIAPMDPTSGTTPSPCATLADSFSSQVSFSRSRGALKGQLYSCSKGENPVEACGTSLWAKGEKVNTYPSLYQCQTQTSSAYF